jgi:hypothetical protein
MNRRFLFGTVTSWCLCILLASPSRAASTEYEVKATFLYNFAKFVDWPPQAFSGNGAAFTMCVAGDPFEGALDRTIQGEVLDGKPLMVRHITGPEDIQGCQIVYVSPSEAATSRDIINAAANAPILTVGETDDFINDGGIVRFVKTGGRIHFQINPDAAQRASLKVSSRLLRLADIVRPRQRVGEVR